MKPFALLLISFLIFSFIGCKKSVTDVPDLPEPEILNFFAREDTVGAVVYIMGRNFDKNPSGNVVTFNTGEAQPFYASSDTLRVRVPKGAATGTIRVKVHSKVAVSKDTFYLLTGKWTKMADCPGDGRFDAVGFSVGNMGYISTGTGYGHYLRDTWAFDPQKNSWTRVADFPEGARREAFSFSIGNKAYVGYGTNTDSFSIRNDFYEFDPATGRWTRKADIPRLWNNNAVGLALNGKGYIITGDYSQQVLEYDPATDEWAVKKDFPGEDRSAASGFVINGKGYLVGGNPGYGRGLKDVWEYDASRDSWTKMADIRSIGYEGTGFSVQGKGYVCNANGTYKQIFEFDPAKNKWSRKKDFPGAATTSSVSFVINGVAYVATGSTYDTVSKEIWRFDPE
ncbi:MAG: kelch repeat-containing protein [Dyadobacter fermentans]